MTGGGFEAVAADIELSAAGMKAAGESVSGADPSGDLGGVSTALPGGESAAAATALATAWTERFSAWGTDASRHGTARSTSAERYTQADYEAGLRMQADALANRGPTMAQDR